MKLISFSSIKRNASVRALSAALLTTLFLTGCSSLNLESAKSLGEEGQRASTVNVENIFYSDDEFMGAMDAEAFIHGLQQKDIPPELLDLYEKVDGELSSRRIVFLQLNTVYEKFSALSSLDAAADTEKAISDLGKAVNGYAASLQKQPVISDSVNGALSRVGGLIAGEVQKKNVKKSSALIRVRLEAFHKLFADPLVKEQSVGFRAILMQDQASAVQTLWKKGVFDASPLIDQMGTVADLKAKNSNQLNVSGELQDGLEKVVQFRLEKRISLLGDQYEYALASISELIKKHKELERDKEVNLGRLRQIVAEMEHISNVFTPKDKK